VVGATVVGSLQVTVPQLRRLHGADNQGPQVNQEGFMDNLCQDVAHLAQEFRARPHGRHGADLQRVLNRMRSEPFVGRYILVQEHKGQPYRLARLGATPSDPISYTGDTFVTLVEAEWAVFKLRWRRLFGGDVPID
jgi:hypothetical protein